MLQSSIPGRRTVGLLDLPSEVLRLVAEQLYDPLVLTQQDRLSKFSYRHEIRFLTSSMGDFLHGRHVAYSTSGTGLVD
jgi:hypothetical protein